MYDNKNLINNVPNKYVYDILVSSSIKSEVNWSTYCYIITRQSVRIHPQYIYLLNK